MTERETDHVGYAVEYESDGETLTVECASKDEAVATRTALNGRILVREVFKRSWALRSAAPMSGAQSEKPVVVVSTTVMKC